MAGPLDTSSAALDRQRAALRRMTPGQRLELAAQLSDEVRMLALAGVRGRQPGLSEEAAEAAVGRIVIRASTQGDRPTRG